MCARRYVIAWVLEAYTGADWGNIEPMHSQHVQKKTILLKTVTATVVLHQLTKYSPDLKRLAMDSMPARRYCAQAH